jgi:hypothetical protein
MTNQTEEQAERLVRTANDIAQSTGLSFTESLEALRVVGGWSATQVDLQHDRCRDCGEYARYSTTIHTPGAPGYHPFR